MSVLIFQFLVAFIVGSILMVGLSFTIYRKSFYYKKAKGQFNSTSQKPGLLSRLVTITILLMMVIFFTGFDLWVLSSKSYSYMMLFLITFFLVTCLSLFDVLFIDYFILLKWRPKFLHIPEGHPTQEYIHQHIKKQFTLGWIFKFIIIILAVSISYIYTFRPI